VLLSQSDIAVALLLLEVDVYLLLSQVDEALFLSEVLYSGFISGFCHDLDLCRFPSVRVRCCTASVSNDVALFLSKADGAMLLNCCKIL
jgi:hypothetical protein